jgi:hypothetical protein
MAGQAPRTIQELMGHRSIETTMRHGLRFRKRDGTRWGPAFSWAAEELARETKLPIGVMEIALTELAHAGRAVEVEPGGSGGYLH